MSTTTDQSTETETPEGTGTAGQTTDTTQPPNTAGGSGTEGGDGGTETEGGNGEAARRRRQLRDTEAERDTLAGHLERHRLRDLERAAGEILAEPGDLLALGGQDLDAFVGESGDVDADAVRAAARALVDTRPGLKAPTRQSGPIGQGRIGAPVKSGATSWAEALGKG